MANFCNQCGSPVGPESRFCPKCGAPVVASAHSADPIQQQPASPAASQPKRRAGRIAAIVAAALAVAAVAAAAWWWTHRETEVRLTSQFVANVAGYTVLGEYHDGLAAAQRGGKWGFINERGELVIPCQFPSPGGSDSLPYPLHYSCGLIGVMSPDTTQVRFGYVNGKGEQVIAPQWSAVGDFGDGLAAVQDPATHRWGYINTRGEQVLPARWALAGQFSQGLAAVLDQFGGRIAFINTKGELVKELSAIYRQEEGGTLPRFTADGICQVRGYAAADHSMPGTWVDKKGNKVAAPARELVKYSNDGKLGYRNSQGQIVVQARFATLGDMHNGVALASLASDPGMPQLVIWGYVDAEGHESFTTADYQRIAQRNQQVQLHNQQQMREQAEHALKQAAAGAYAKVLRQVFQLVKATPDGGWSSYMMHDIDGNGMPELWVTYGPSWGEGRLEVWNFTETGIEKIYSDDTFDAYCGFMRAAAGSVGKWGYDQADGSYCNLGTFSWNGAGISFAPIEWGVAPLDEASMAKLPSAPVSDLGTLRRAFGL